MDGIMVGLPTGQLAGHTVSWSIGQLVNHTVIQSYERKKVQIFNRRKSGAIISRLQRQSKHGALRRLKGQAAAPFPDKSSSRFAASVFIGKTLYPTAPCKRAFENGNDRPAAHHRPKGKNNKVGLYG